MRVRSPKMPLPLIGQEVPTTVVQGRKNSALGSPWACTVAAGSGTPVSSRTRSPRRPAPKMGRWARLGGRVTAVSAPPCGSAAATSRAARSAAAAEALTRRGAGGVGADGLRRRGHLARQHQRLVAGRHEHRADAFAVGEVGLDPLAVGIAHAERALGGIRRGRGGAVGVSRQLLPS